MAGICTAHARLNGASCDHRSITVSLDGENFTFSTGEGELDAMAWGDAEKRQLILLGLKRLRVAGLALDDSVGRVCNGDEGNNVKEYTFLGPGAAITKTNIGTSYVNICPGANGERILVDLTGCIQFRPFLTANLLATGPFQVRIVRDSDNTVFYESPSISQTGERELDPGWTDLPAGFSGQEILRVQAKSATATDDPVFRRITMLLK